MKPKKKLNRYFRDCPGVGNYRRADHGKLRKAPLGKENQREIDPRFGHISAKMIEFERVRQNLLSFKKGLGAIGNQFADEQLNQRLVPLFLKLGRETDGWMPACGGVTVKDHGQLLGFELNAHSPMDRDLLSAIKIIVNKELNAVVLKVDRIEPWVPEKIPNGYHAYHLVLVSVRLFASRDGYLNQVPSALYHATDGYGGCVQSEAFSVDLNTNVAQVLCSNGPEALVLQLPMPEFLSQTTEDVVIVLLGLKFISELKDFDQQTCYCHGNRMAVVGVF